MKYKSIIIIIIVCLVSLNFVASCKSSHAYSQQKEIEKRKTQRKKETELQYKNAVKQHQNIQTKETRKRMKKTQKRSGKINKPKKKTFFLSRWFSKDKCLD